MVCYSPLKGFRSRSNRGIVFSVSQGYIDKPVEVPCGQCIGCRLERSRQWAVRCVHEASLYDSNCFITLTYSDENLDKSGSLVPRDFVLFMKKLRSKFVGRKIRYFHCGEYGENFARPHHHACIFNLDFEDKYLWSTRNGVKLYRSDFLESVWSKGYCTLGDVTFESAAYVARYVTKKITGKKAFEHYAVIDKESGEVISYRKPEYVTMSRRPGIAHDWIKEFKSDVYPSDNLVIRNGLIVKPPRYYDTVYDEVLSGDMRHVKIERAGKAALRKEDNSSSRLYTRKKFKEAQLNILKRSLEGG